MQDVHGSSKMGDSYWHIESNTFESRSSHSRVPDYCLAGRIQLVRWDANTFLQRQVKGNVVMNQLFRIYSTTRYIIGQVMLVGKIEKLTKVRSVYHVDSLAKRWRKHRFHYRPYLEKPNWIEDEMRGMGVVSSEKERCVPNYAPCQTMVAGSQSERDSLWQETLVLARPS